MGSGSEHPHGRGLRSGLDRLCKKFGIVNENPHDAFSDAMAEADVYRALLRHELF